MTLPGQSATLADVALAATRAHYAAAEAYELAYSAGAAQEVKDELWAACMAHARAEHVIAESRP